MSNSEIYKSELRISQEKLSFLLLHAGLGESIQSFKPSKFLGFLSILDPMSCSIFHFHDPYSENCDRDSVPLQILPNRGFFDWNRISVFREQKGSAA